MTTISIRRVRRIIIEQFGLPKAHLNRRKLSANFGTAPDENS